MIFEIGKELILVKTESDPDNILSVIKSYFTVYPELVRYNYLAGKDKNYFPNTKDKDELEAMIPIAKKVSLTFMNWVVFNYNKCCGIEPSNYNQFFYAGQSIPIKDTVLQKDTPIKISTNGKMATCHLGYFYDIYFLLKQKYPNVLRIANGTTYKGVELSNCLYVSPNKNFLKYKDQPVYSCGKISLMDRQIEDFNSILEFLKSKQGQYCDRLLLNLHVGYGKTFMAASLIDNIESVHKVIFTCHAKSLLYKNVEDFAGVMGYDVDIIAAKSDYNAIKKAFKDKGYDDSKLNLGITNSKILFAMIRSIKDEDLSGYNVAIIDECNEQVTPTNLALLDRLNLSFILGLSGTPYGSPDVSQHLKVKGYFGHEIVIKDISSGVSNDAIVQYDIDILNHENFLRTTQNGFVEWYNKDMHIYKSPKRLLLVSDYIKNNPGNYFIYTGTTKITIGYTLYHHLKDHTNCKVEYLTGQLSSKEFVEKLSAFKDGASDVIIANTILTSAENLGIADHIIMWYSGTNDRMLEQSLGRILRKRKDKKLCKVILIKDNYINYKDQSELDLIFDYNLRKFISLYPETNVNYLNQQLSV